MLTNYLSIGGTKVLLRSCKQHKNSVYSNSITIYLFEAGHEKRYQVLVSSYGDDRQNVKVIEKTEIGLWKIRSCLLINLCL